MDQDIDSWECATDNTLHGTSLSTISKSLPARTSKRRTLALYLRWLEIHRYSGSKSTQHWVNTIMHWTQALRARGFIKEDINHGIKRWKEGNGYRVGKGRNMPTWEDVEDVFYKKGLTSKDSEGEGRRAMERADEKEERRERRRMDRYEKDEKESFKGRLEKKRPSEFRKKVKWWTGPEEKYAGVPYKGYICKRCGYGGHHLQACPTNLDPSWDEPPDEDHECTVCGLKGVHFKSLCPQNTDPLCLTQKRKRAGIITTPEKKSNPFTDWERDISHRSRERMDATSHREGGHGREYSRSSNLSESGTPTGNNKRLELFAIDEKRRGLLAEVQADYIRNVNSKSESTSSSKYESSSSPHHHKRAREYPENESNFGRLSLNTDHDSSSPEEGRKRVRFAEPKSSPIRFSRSRRETGFVARAKKEEGAYTSNFDPHFNPEAEMELDNDMSDDEHRPPLSYTLLTTLFPLASAFETSGRDVDVNMADCTNSTSSEEGGKIVERVGVAAMEKKYNAFVVALVKRHPEMSVVVNVQRYGTAADLWNSHTSRRVETTPGKLALGSPLDSQYPSSISPPRRFEHDGVREEENFTSFDGAADDRSPSHYQPRCQKRTRLSYDDHESEHDDTMSFNISKIFEREQKPSSLKKGIPNLPRTFSSGEEDVDAVYPVDMVKLGGESFAEREMGMGVEMYVEGELRIEGDGDDEHLAKEVLMDKSGYGGKAGKGEEIVVEVAEFMELSD